MDKIPIYTKIVDNIKMKDVDKNPCTKIHCGIVQKYWPLYEKLWTRVNTNHWGVRGHWIMMSQTTNGLDLQNTKVSHF